MLPRSRSSLTADIAVVVPSYNLARTVLQTLESVAVQCLLPRRLIVVDAGSTDETAASVQGWCSRTPLSIHTTIICQPNCGLARRGTAAYNKPETVDTSPARPRWRAIGTKQAVPLLPGATFCGLAPAFVKRFAGEVFICLRGYS